MNDTISERRVISRVPFPREGVGRERNGKINLKSLYDNPLGRIDPIDTTRNELITLRRGGKVVEFMGMVKGGKSKHIQLLCDRLRNDEELRRGLGGPIAIEVFKPNSLVKILFEKDPHSRAIYNEVIIHSHGLVLNMLYLETKADVNIATREIDLALLDRGPTDDIVWTYALHDYKGFIADEVRDQHLAMAQALEKYVDLVIGINVPPELAMQREGEREGNVMTPPFLRRLYTHYQRMSEESKQLGQPSDLDTSYLDIDGTADIKENARRIYERVKGLYVPQEAEELEKIAKT